jgi:uncharacterized membrane protein
MERGRLEAFSDGVFAVAITLLALGLAVAGPGRGHPSLAHQLGHQWPAFVAYVVSFFTVGIIWVNHHALISNLVVVDRTLMFLNLLLLLFVVMVPFSTSIVADYLAYGGFDAQVAVAVYGGVLVGMSVGFSSMFEWSLHKGRSKVQVPRDRWWRARLRFASGLVIYVAIVGLAFWNALVAFALSGAVAVYYVFERTPSVRPPGAPRPADAPPAPPSDPD